MFLTNNGDAASIFYQNIAFHLSTNSVAKLAAMLQRCLSAAIEADVKAEAAVQRQRRRVKRGAEISLLPMRRMVVIRL